MNRIHVVVAFFLKKNNFNYSILWSVVTVCLNVLLFWHSLFGVSVTLCDVSHVLKVAIGVNRRSDSTELDEAVPIGKYKRIHSEIGATRKKIKVTCLDNLTLILILNF